MEHLEIHKKSRFNNHNCHPGFCCNLGFFSNGDPLFTEGLAQNDWYGYFFEVEKSRFAFAIRLSLYHGQKTFIFGQKTHTRTDQSNTVDITICTMILE